MTTADYLDAVKSRLLLPSDYALQNVIGASRQQISRYRTGKDYLGDDVALRVAEILDVPPGRVLADVAAERAKSDAVREVWRRLSAVAAGGACAVILTAAPGDGNALPISRLTSAGQGDTLNITRNPPAPPARQIRQGKPARRCRSSHHWRRAVSLCVGWRPSASSSSSYFCRLILRRPVSTACQSCRCP